MKKETRAAVTHYLLEKFPRISLEMAEEKLGNFEDIGWNCEADEMSLIDLIRCVAIVTREHT